MTLGTGPNCSGPGVFHSQSGVYNMTSFVVVMRLLQEPQSFYKYYKVIINIHKVLKLIPGIIVIFIKCLLNKLKYIKHIGIFQGSRFRD